MAWSTGRCSQQRNSCQLNPISCASSDTSGYCFNLESGGKTAALHNGCADSQKWLSHRNIISCVADLLLCAGWERGGTWLHFGGYRGGAGGIFANCAAGGEMGVGGDCG